MRRTVKTVEWNSIEEGFAGDGTAAGGGALLLGNGFSTNIWSEFGYSTLLERSGLDGTARDLFGTRTNFETILAELATTRAVLGVAAPDEEALLLQLEGLAAEVRDALLETVDVVHPDAYQLVARLRTPGRLVIVGTQVLDSVASLLARYSRVFVTNYDLIAYWAAVQGQVADLFHGSDPFDEQLAEYWLRNNAQPKIFFLHGALHLWRSLVTNKEGKHTASQETTLLDVIRSSVNSPDRVPLFISEGSSAEKVARISASPYLSFCGRVLAETKVPLTVLGHGLSDVDQHICSAIEHDPDREVSIGIWVGDIDDPDDRKNELVTRATQVHGRISKCRNVVFFDSSEHPLTKPELHCA